LTKLRAATAIGKAPEGAGFKPMRASAIGEKEARQVGHMAE
jgi:hypothetical protein